MFLGCSGTTSLGGKLVFFIFASLPLRRRGLVVP